MTIDFNKGREQPAFFEQDFIPLIAFDTQECIDTTGTCIVTYIYQGDIFRPKRIKDTMIISFLN